MQSSIGEGRRIDRSSSATQQPKQLGNHCHVCNFLRCDSICYFNAQNVTLSMSDDGGRWRWFVILYFAVCVHHLLHSSLLTNWNPISQSNLAKRQGSVVYKLLYQIERQDNIVWFNKTAIWTKLILDANHHLLLVTAKNAINAQSSLPIQFYALGVVKSLLCCKVILTLSLFVWEVEFMGHQ